MLEIANAATEKQLADVLDFVEANTIWSRDVFVALAIENFLRMYMKHDPVHPLKVQLASRANETMGGQLERIVRLYVVFTKAQQGEDGYGFTKTQSGWGDDEAKEGEVHWRVYAPEGELL